MLHIFRNAFGIWNHQDYSLRDLARLMALLCQVFSCILAMHSFYASGETVQVDPSQI